MTNLLKAQSNMDGRCLADFDLEIAINSSWQIKENSMIRKSI